MPTFFSPGGNPEVWEEKPEGYFTPEEWAAAHPAPESEDDSDSLLQARLTAIDYELTCLDAIYLTPRVLANLTRGDEYARTSYEQHEAAAIPLRQERSEISLLIRE